MGQDGDLTPMKEIQNPILDMPLFGAQFMNSVTQIIGCRAAKFVAQLGQEFDTSAAVRPGFLVASTEFPKPVHHGSFALCLLVECNVCSGHNPFTDKIITILLLVQNNFPIYLHNSSNGACF